MSSLSAIDFSTLLAEIAKRHSQVNAYLFSEKHRLNLGHEHLEAAVLSYLKAGGKSLRSAVMMFCCGAVGGDETHALPAAAAIELYHTYTLVHDDIIDRDELRRGTATVHVDFANRAQKELGYDAATAEHYGLAVAILTGDIQQGWAASFFPLLTSEFKVPAQLALNLISELFHTIQAGLVRGETLDIEFSQMPVDHLTETQVIDMLRQKTGVLYEFAGRAGAAIGLAQPNLRHPDVERFANFTGNCGIAFQLQDDILGIVGNKAQLGKPVGSDIREGKRTLVLLGSLPNMTPAQRSFTLGVVGNQAASHADIEEVTALLQSAGGIAYAQRRAQEYIQSALDSLATVPESYHKELLKTWAAYIIDRQV